MNLLAKKELSTDECMELFKKYDPKIHEHYFNDMKLFGCDAKNYAQHLKDKHEPGTSLLKEPLYGIVYDWKGLKEENYLYTAEELLEMDPEHVLPETTDDPVDGAFWGNKTYRIYRLETEKQVGRFLTGSHNGMPVSMESDSYEGLLLEWYWESCDIYNDLFGKRSDTMKKVISQLNIPKEHLSGDGFEEVDFYEVKYVTNDELYYHSFIIFVEAGSSPSALTIENILKTNDDIVPEDATVMEFHKTTQEEYIAFYCSVLGPKREVM